MGSSGDWKVFLSIFRGWIGCAFIGMPYGFVSVGLIPGTLGVFLLGILALHCALLLVQCKLNHGTEDSTYSDIVERALGPKAVPVVDFLLSFCHFGFCVSYSVSLLRALDPLFPPRVSLIFLSLSLALATSSLPAAPLASIGSLFVFPALFLTLLCFSPTSPSSSNVPWFNFSSLPLFLGMSSSAHTGIGLVLPSHSSCSSPTRFPLLLSAAVTLSSIVLSVFGTLGALSFGPLVSPVVTSNLPPSLFSSLAQTLLSLSLFLAFPLQLSPAIAISERTLHPDPHLIPFWRAAIPILVCFSAVHLPNFALIYGFVGAFGGSSLAFVIPIACYLSLQRPTGWNRTVHIILLIASLLLTLICTTVSAIEILSSA